MDELNQKIIELTEKGISLIELAALLEINEYEVFGRINDLKREGINIFTSKKDDDIYFINQGESKLEKEVVEIEPVNDQIKLAVISDTRLGSKYAQITILNDIYEKALSLDCDAVLHCGNLSEGLYKITNKYCETLFKEDTLSQVDYIANVYPYIDYLKTYFITGKKDETHLKQNKTNLGKRVSDKRNDLIYCGDSLCDIKIWNSDILMMNSRLGKTYTNSYRTQQMADSFRSEDKPDLLLIGGLLQMEKFRYRDIDCISVPSVVATTEEMEEKRYSNAIGAWYLTIKFNKKGQIESIIPLASPYYITKKEDYKTAKVLKKGGMI